MFSFLQYDLYMQVIFVTKIISQTTVHLFETLDKEIFSEVQFMYGPVAGMETRQG